MSLIETAKDLLRKGIQLNDPEIIEMANQLLGQATPKASLEVRPSIQAIEPEPHPTPAPQPEEVVERPIREIVSEKDFSTKTNAALPAGNAPVGGGNFHNTFVDDGSEFSDVETPQVSRSQRREPIKYVQQTCDGCSKVFDVHPTFARETYLCDRCIRNKVKK